MPRCFDDAGGPQTGSQRPADLADDTADKLLPLPGVMNATCELSLLLYRVMEHNAACHDVGSQTDLASRRQYYNENQELRRHLARHLQHEQNFAPQTSFLRQVYELNLYWHITGAVLTDATEFTTTRWQLQSGDRCIQTL